MKHNIFPLGSCEIVAFKIFPCEFVFSNSTQPSLGNLILLFKYVMFYKHLHLYENLYVFLL